MAVSKIPQITRAANETKCAGLAKIVTKMPHPARIAVFFYLAASLGQRPG